MGLKGPPREWPPERQAAYWLLLNLMFFESEGALRDSDSSALNDVWQSYNKLATLYKPHHHLPNHGQELWRELEDVLEQPKVKKKVLLIALDEFRQWLVDHYALGRGPEKENTPAKKVLPKQELNEEEPPKPVRRRGRSDRNVLFLRLFLNGHHKPERGRRDYTPATQRQMMEWLRWPQSKVSRAMKKLYGGMKRYYQACRRRDLSILDDCQGDLE